MFVTHFFLRIFLFIINIIILAPEKTIENWEKIKMNTEYYDQSGRLNRLTLPQVGKEINRSNPESIRKWLLEKNITIHRQSNTNFVYQVEFDCEMDKPFVFDIRRKYPDCWKEIYRNVSKDLAVYNLMLIILKEEPTPLPTTKVVCKSITDNKLLKSLMS
jgi:hypothetical protein